MKNEMRWSSSIETCDLSKRVSGIRDLDAQLSTRIALFWGHWPGITVIFFEKRHQIHDFQKTMATATRSGFWRTDEHEIRELLVDPSSDLHLLTLGSSTGFYWDYRPCCISHPRIPSREDSQEVEQERHILLWELLGYIAWKEVGKYTVQNHMAITDENNGTWC